MEAALVAGASGERAFASAEGGRGLAERPSRRHLVVVVVVLQLVLAAAVPLLVAVGARGAWLLCRWRVGGVFARLVGEAHLSAWWLRWCWCEWAPE